MLTGFSAALNGFTAVVGDIVFVRLSSQPRGGKSQLDTLRSAAMSRNLKKYITPLLATAAAAVAIAAAPTAFATDQQSCNGSGSGTVCLSPGNVPIKTSPPDVQHHPSGDMPDLTVQDFAKALGLTT
jgi:hypothetical protein